MLAAMLLLERQDELAECTLDVMAGGDGDVVALAVGPLQAEGACAKQPSMCV